MLKLIGGYIQDKNASKHFDQLGHSRASLAYIKLCQYDLVMLHFLTEE